MFIYDVTNISLNQSTHAELSTFCKSEKVDLDYLVYTLKSTKKSSRK